LALEKWLKKEHSRRFHPRRFMISSKATAPAQIMLNYPKSAGTIVGGAGTVPSFIVPVLFISYLQMDFSESPFFLGEKSTKNKTHQKCDENSGKKSQDEKHNGMSFSMTRST
jgi:hypothetical protein